MGYPGPLGAEGIAYAYVDAVAVVHAGRAPRPAAAAFSERLALLPHSYYLTDYASSWRQLLAPPPPPADAELRLSRGAALLCSLNQLPKLDPTLFGVWLNALRRSNDAPPPTKLWLLRFPATAEPNLQSEASAHASPVRPSRLLFLDTAPYAAHLRRAAHCDLFVDSLLCNAHTSATDALWAGTPVLTLPGATQTARVAASLLRALGLSHLVQSSLRGYEDAVVALTTAPTAGLRAGGARAGLRRQ